MADVTFTLQVDEELVELFRETCVPDISIFLVDENGEPLENPTEEEIDEATSEAEEQAERNLFQNLINVPVTNALKARLRGKVEELRNADDVDTLAQGNALRKKIKMHNIRGEKQARKGK